MTKYIKYLFFIAIALVINACATYKAQVKNANSNELTSDKEIEHSFYLIGDAGNSDLGLKSEALLAFQKELRQASQQSTVLFLGDNIYPKGLPGKKSEDRELAQHRLDVQIEAVKDFKGEAIFIPGNHDWYSGLKGLKRQEKYVEDILGKNTFLPENGCPLETIDISDEIQLILIDSEWYITNWDHHPTINDNCEIKTRTKFYSELRSVIKKARGKTTIIALHHPMFTNGPHGGQYTFGSHMKPLPVVGTLKNVLRKTSGVSPADLQHKRYNEFRKQVIALSQQNDKVIFVSGHEHSLQYLRQDNIPQIISGAGSKVTGTRDVGTSKFTYGTAGYARLDVFKDGSSQVAFYSVKDSAIVYRAQVFSPEIEKKTPEFKDHFPSSVKASIYTEEQTKKSGFYKFLWGERYRKYFSTKVTAPTVNLDTLFGGLTPVRRGGGNQSKSLRMKDPEGREYVVRALKKNPSQYLQATIFKDQYVEGQFDNTFTEDLLYDVFAGSHPYAPFVIGDLSDAVGVYHTNPVLYYVPKQPALGIYNDEYGDELYMIEERASNDHGDKASFGFSNNLISTDDILKKLHKDEDFVIDEASYIRARLFDMLIGDWDRHEDQWRWIKFKENGKTVYRPMPRDRDQAFSIMSDGFLLGSAVTLIPNARLLRKYDTDLKDVQGVNVEPYPLDMALINESGKAAWDIQVQHIQENLTDAAIDNAFKNFPKEVQGPTIDEIKQKLKGRRTNLQAISDRYFKVINKFAVVTGTDKDDYFMVECLGDGKVTVTAQRIKKGERADVFHQRTYNSNETKEIWIYGLDDDDVFEVKGKNTKIKLRIIGGQNNDTYRIPDGGRVYVYDHKSKKNDVSQAKKARIRLRDDYETNVYDFKKLKNNTNQLVPSIGSNPDDGFKIGVKNTYTAFGFERNPFTVQHTFSAMYYFATQGYDLDYNAEFANIFGNFNAGLDIAFNSPNYAINFFGFGNSTSNPEAEENDGLDVDLDYNRVKIRTFSIAPSLIWRGQLGASFKIAAFYESNEIDKTTGRFISLPNSVPAVVFDKQDFYGGEIKYHFQNVDNKAFPTLGMEVGLLAGYKNNVSTSKGFAYVIPELSFDYRLIPSGQLVLATKSWGHFNLGDDFEFYQGAFLGAKTGLRGYRNERFTGKSAFVQSTDIRWNFSDLKTGLLPIHIGVYAGADIGKVWVDNALVSDARFNSDDWNTSVGGGLFVNVANMMTGNISAFNSDDGLRFAFKVGFGF